MAGASTKKVVPVAKYYAKALFELSQEQKQLDAIHKEFEEFASFLREQAQLKHALTGYTLSVDDKEKIFSELSQKMQLNELFARFLKLLIVKSRLVLLDSIYDAFRGLVDESKSMVRGTVTTVESLTEPQVEDLSKAFGKRFNKNVLLESVVDKEILGGLVVKVQGLTFDGSLKTTIRRLKETLERQSL